jgi:hypothetical protein
MTLTFVLSFEKRSHFTTKEHYNVFLKEDTNSWDKENMTTINARGRRYMEVISSM